MTILRLIAGGYSNREIAERVHLSENTIKSHVQEIFRKLNVGIVSRQQCEQKSGGLALTDLGRVMC